MRMERRRRRSTQTPAGSAKRMNGRKLRTPSAANSNGVACSERAARMGMARAEICEPNSLTVWPVQSFMKSGWLQRALVGLRIRVPLVEGDGESVRVAHRILGLAELRDQPVEPAVEPDGVVLVEPDADRAGAADGVALGIERQDLVGGDAQRGRDDVAHVPGVGGVVALVEE